MQEVPSGHFAPTHAHCVNVHLFSVHGRPSSHEWPHRRQFLIVPSVSQPSASLSLLQSAHPSSQAPVHSPPAQIGSGTWLSGRRSPQPPQVDRCQRRGRGSRGRSRSGPPGTGRFRGLRTAFLPCPRTRRADGHRGRCCRPGRSDTHPRPSPILPAGPMSADRSRRGRRRNGSG